MPAHGDKNSLIAKGLERFRAGDLDAALGLFAEVLKTDPDDPDALHLTGLCHFQAGRLDAAVAHVEKAVARAGTNDVFLNNLGQIFKAAGDLAAAADCYRRAIDANPASFEAPNNLGAIHATLGEPEEAIRHFRLSVERNPNYATAHYNLGTVYMDGDDPAEAIPCFERVLAIDPAYAEAHNNLGIAHQRLGDFPRAADCYRSALEIRPRYAEAHYNLGHAHSESGDPDSAIECYRKAIEIEPDHVAAITNLAQDLKRTGALDDAMAAFRKAIEFDADWGEARKGLGMAHMLKGDFRTGWQEYEWRWRVKGGERLGAFPQPLWQGEDLTDKTILVWGEQGVGDELLFAGMIPDLADRGARVLVESDPRLVPLFRRSFAGIECIAREDPPASLAGRADIDFHVPTGNLGRYLRSDVADFPGRPSYLSADPARTKSLRQKYLESADPVLIGVSWISKNKQIGSDKSMTLADLRPLSRIPGIALIDLQYGDTADERRAFEEAAGVTVVHDDEIDQMADLDTFAAQVAALDLVISVSNTTVHMAGALGVPTWVMLNSMPLTFWLLDRDDSPWYPALRLFRQSRRGAWDDVVERIADALGRFVAGDGP